MQEQLPRDVRELPNVRSALKSFPRLALTQKFGASTEVRTVIKKPRLSRWGFLLGWYFSVNKKPVIAREQRDCGNLSSDYQLLLKPIVF